MRVKKDLGLLGALGQVAQVVEKQEVEVVQPAQLPGQGQVALGGQEFLHQAVGWSEEDGVAGFHQPVAHGAQRVGLAGAGQARRPGTFGRRVSVKSPLASWSSCCRSDRGIRSCSKVSQVLPEGSRDAVRRRSMRR